MPNAASENSIRYTDPLESTSTEQINEAVRKHQLDESTSWSLQHRIRRLHEFFSIFNERLFGAQPLPLAAISVDPERRTRLGHYRIGRNGLGLIHNINLNAKYLEDQTLLEQLVTLAHEMVHQWQYIYGRPPKTASYHNKEWCQMATGLGLVSVPPRGDTVRISGPFLEVCREHSVNDPVPPVGTVPMSCSRRLRRGEGRSTLSKWSCRCDPPQSVWSGRSELVLLCPICGSGVGQMLLNLKQKLGDSGNSLGCFLTLNNARAEVFATRWN